MAKVVVNRPERKLGSFLSFHVFIDGMNVASLENGDYAVIEMPGGVASLQVKRSLFNGKSGIVELELKDSDTIEFDVTPSRLTTIMALVIVSVGFFSGVFFNVLKDNPFAYVLIIMIIILPSFFIDDLELIAKDHAHD